MRFLFLLFMLGASLVSDGQTDSVLIKVYDGTTDIFPYEWHSKKISAKATLPEKDSIAPALKAIEIAMGKYPLGSLKELKKVYITGTLTCYHVKYSGTNSSRNLYIAINKNDVVEKTFHHEYSSILLRNHSYYFDSDRWKQLSPELLNTTSADALKRGYNSIQGVEPALLEKGYLDLYSLSNLENDFNMYAENIFAGGKDFWKLVDKYPLVKEKTLLVIAFYKKINPIWEEVFFRYLAD